MFINEDGDVIIVVDVEITDTTGHPIRRHVSLQRKYSPYEFTSMMEPQAGDKLKFRGVELVLKWREQDICLGSVNHVTTLVCEYTIVIPGPEDKERVIQALIASDLKPLTDADFKPVSRS